jgi:PAS domain S-box-containing protein
MLLGRPKMTAEPKAESPTSTTRSSSLSLRAKGVAVLSIPAAALFVALFAMHWLEETGRASEDEAARAMEAQAKLQRLQVSVLDADAGVNRYMGGDAGALASFDMARSAAGRLVTSLEPSIGDDVVGSRALDGVKRSTYAAFRALGQLTAGNWQPEALEHAREAVAEMRMRAAELDRAQDSLIARARAERDGARRKVFRVMLACGILGPLGALFAHLIIAGRLIGRLQGVQENARRLAHGLPLAAFPTGTDEIASLAKQLENAAYLMRGRERELRESEARYRDLFDRAPIPYEETDAKGVVRRFNKEVCALLKSPANAVMGRHAWDYVAPAQKEAFRSAMLQRIATGSETGPFECDYLLEDGSVIRVEIRESLIRGEGGAVEGVCRSVLDVTERNLSAVAARKVAQYAMELRTKNEQLARALDAARSATEAKSRFLASVSHELRTPLNGIIGFSELLYDGKLGPLGADHRDVMGDILISARHLLQLINDILDLSKVEAGKMEFHAEVCEIDALVHEVRDVMRPLADRKQLQLTTDVPSRLAANIDRSRFKQVLYNYLSNAVKFTPEGGRIRVSVVPLDSGNFRLDVEDSGIGISPEEMPLLFREFQQLPGGRKAEQGTGLGLALTRLIVEAQGGTVTARSLPGQGSVFSAILPLYAEASSTVR